MKRIDPTDLVDMQEAGKGLLRTELIYADPGHPLNGTFREAIYKPDAKLWLHRELANIVLEAAKNGLERHHVHFVLTDGLRTVDAQKRMLDTATVQAHPHWLSNGLLSSPGNGGHPRGMAVDILLETLAGDVIDMGTPLDYFSTNPNNNPAARDYKDFPATVLANRALLESLMLESAKKNQTPLLPLPSEWWDFRLPPDIYEHYAPLSDADLPPDMRMCAGLPVV